MSVISYVVMVVVDESARTSIGLIKRKGPPFLIGKICYPGGKIEAGESPAQAASRELEEETALIVSPDQWRYVGYREDPHHELHVLACAGIDVSQARQQEEEPLVPLSLTEHLTAALAHPERYSPDFLQLTFAALRTLELPV